MVAGGALFGEHKANMLAAATVRLQVESALRERVPSALTPQTRLIRPIAATGVSEVDRILRGGIPVGAITEIVGPECSGRTTLALSSIARATRTGKVCAWIDVSDSLDPAAASAAGVDITRLLWVRCGALAELKLSSPATFAFPEPCFTPAPIPRGLHGGGHGPHPRTEGKGLSTAINRLLQPRCSEPLRRSIAEKEALPIMLPSPGSIAPLHSTSAPHARLDQALRVADLLLQVGGFSTIVFDMAGLTPQQALHVPLATWFRYRAAAEKTQSSIILLSQHHCTKSSAGLLLRLAAGEPLNDSLNLFTGCAQQAEVARQRFAQPPDKVVPLRKPPQSDDSAAWRSRPDWAAHA